MITRTKINEWLVEPDIEGAREYARLSVSAEHDRAPDRRVVVERQKHRCITTFAKAGAFDPEIVNWHQFSSSDITAALTGPPPINVDFRNDATRNSASNAMVGVIVKQPRLVDGSQQHCSSSRGTTIQGRGLVRTNV